MIIKNARFRTSVATVAGYKDESAKYSCAEIAIAGRSNVGKSSFINLLVGQKKLAKTSSTPGRTRQLNLFDINNGEFILVDLPGYGYAKGSMAEIERFRKLTDSYFSISEKLSHTFSLVDIRHEPSQQDILMISYLYESNKPFTIVATKADKLSKAQRDKAIQVLATALKVGKDDIIAFSAETGQGKDLVLTRIEKVLENYAE
ncbi:MAG: YihA family ribosome biogenesis GTP-binding protein [Clostridia bacterium]|nr:YihA family ribosome biogenesis GTP-binding protein [Clostridia bacterium]MBP5593068.1 YihA family ribosome biogenesis GTP-binding protein [Clostridia bacterium]MBP5649020.1 YihA family ribosome biogenesis GTP-binding protein [Clostridia bacterium]